jgi:hypothetical protein
MVVVLTASVGAVAVPPTVIELSGEVIATPLFTAAVVCVVQQLWSVE